MSKGNDGKEFTIKDIWLALEPPTAARLESFSKLHEDLARACAKHEQLGDDGRKGAAEALHAVLEFLASRGVPDATCTPLSNLLAALYDSSRGVQSPLTKVVKSARGAPQSNIQKLQAKGLLAAIAQYFYLHGKTAGWTLEVSMRGAVKSINAGGRFGSKDIKWTELKRHREEVRAMGKDEIPKQIFDTLIDSEIGGARPLEYGAGLARNGLIVFPSPKSE